MAAQLASLNHLASELDLQACAREALHHPGHIQPLGGLLAVQPDGLIITHASENLGTYLGQAPAALLGQPLARAIGPAAIGALLAVAPRGDELGDAEITGPDGRHLSLHAYRAGAAIGIDLEPGQPGPALPALSALLESLSSAADRVALCGQAVRGLHALLGYDRVMAYRFAEDLHGEVIAEAIRPGVPSYLGLHYPASDIPPQARALYLRKLVGEIADAAYHPVPLLAAPAAATLDLTSSALRGISGKHLQYMRNMGTAAALRIALVEDGALWGLLVGHHLTPRGAGPAARAAAAMVGQAASLRLAPLREAETRIARRARRGLLDALPARLARTLPIADALAATPELLGLLQATGALVSVAGKTAFLGDPPPPHAALRALAVLQIRAGGSPLAIEDLGAADPSLADCAPKGSGALLLPLSEATDDAILWFRPELRAIAHWGGNPDEHAFIDPDTQELTPRRSFAAWRRDIAGRAAPWTAADLHLAHELRGLYEIELARRASAELAHLRDHDQLTGLPKWSRMQARLASAAPAHATLLIIAFGQLQDIAETLGPAAADAVIIEIATRLRGAAGPRDELARLDDAQFVMLCASPGPLAAEALGARIREALRAPCAAAGARELTPAIRHVMADAAGGLDLADAAYLAMRAAKAEADFNRRVEAQRQKMESLGRMIGGIAHEINNMLQPVALLGQDLLDRGLEGEARETLDIILDCARQARQIIGDILAFSRPKERAVERADPAVLLEEKLRLIRQAVPADVTIRVEAAPGLPAIAVNGTAFAQILLNLATNATAAMDGLGTLTFRLDEVPAEFGVSEKMLRLAVIDTGRGMSKETLEHAFEPFFTTKEVGKGTGLGLPVVFGLVDEMGGRIALASEPGLGTTVTILLPAAGRGAAAL